MSIFNSRGVELYIAYEHFHALRNDSIDGLGIKECVLTAMIVDSVLL